MLQSQWAIKIFKIIPQWPYIQVVNYRKCTDYCKIMLNKKNVIVYWYYIYLYIYISYYIWYFFF